MGKKKMIGLFLVVGLAGVVLIGAGVDFAGDLVVRETTKAVKETLGADLIVDGISGNPIKGFTTGKITLVKEGKPLFSADFLEVKLNLMSLLSKSPKLRVVSVGGVTADADALAEQISRLSFESGSGGEIPVETVRLVDSTITSKWAKADITSIGLSFSGKDIDADLDLAVNGVAVRGKTAVLLDGNIVDVKSMALNVGKGSVSASGRVSPSLAVSGTLKELDLKELVAFWPVVPADGFDGKVSLNFRGDGEWNAPSFAGDVNYSGKSVLGYPVDSVRAKWALGADKLSVTDLEAGVLAMPLSGSMSLGFAPGKPPVLDLDLAGTSIKVAELKKLYPDIGDVSGEIDKFTLKLSGAADALDGTVEFSAPVLGAFGYSVTNSAAQVKINPKVLTVSAKSNFEGAPITAQGTITDYMTSPKLNLTGNLRSFNLAKAAALVPELKDPALAGTVNADVTVKGTAAVPEISGKAWSNKLTAMKETVEAPSVSFALKGKTVNIIGASAKWRGSSLSGSGTIAADGKLNLKATLENLQPGAIAAFYPDIARYKIKGAVTAGATVTGTTSTPKIDLSLTSGLLGLLDMATFKNLKVATTLAGDLKAIEKADLDLDIGAGSAAVQGITFSDLAVKLRKTGQKINISSASVKSGKGTITGSGSATLGAKQGEDGTLDLAAKISGADLGFIAGAGGLDFPLGGVVDGTVTVKGPFSNPAVTVKASSPKVTLSGMAATDVALGLSGNTKEMKIEEFSSKFGGGTLGATGNVKLGAAPDITVDISGKDLDLAVLTSGMPDAKEFRIGGRVNATFKGRFAGASGKGEGAVTSQSLTVMGLKATALNYPLVLEGNTLSGKGAGASFYGGKASGNGSLDISTMKFSHSVELSGVDVNGVLQDFTGGLGGKITGLAQGSANVSGTLAPKFAFSGKGSAKIGEGAVSGFKVLDIVTKLHGISGIRYTEVTAPFRLETGRIIFEKGTKATAPQNDPLYRFLTAEGPVGPKGALKLQVAGNVNIQIINALAGGTLGGLTAGSLEDALRGVLGGARKGMEKADFRDISFSVGGTVEKPSVSNLNVAPGAQQPAATQLQNPAEQPQAPKTPQQAIIDQIMNPAPAPAPASPTEEPKKPADIIKEKLLESIFNKK
ncbi:hypothetical protein [Aminivibrio sp.]|uniref:hypothetical protein n=1 Tax=Aminivibrio sp. TaxID=1872489 RepID=UPI001A5EB2ED|nr:hypothetical protein [Aminivibrio sp.]MBL3539417.1 hypothetical protein [Aminivibrio sp.]